MKRILFFLFSFLITITMFSCASVPSYTKDRQLNLSGYSVSETDFGGVERWFAVDKYNYDSFIDEVRLQVGYFNQNSIGFILYGNGTVGEEAYYHRDGLNLRWDWGSDGYGTSYKYSFVIEPDGTGLYYDFSASTDGTSKPRGIYKVHKF